MPQHASSEQNIAAGPDQFSTLLECSPEVLAILSEDGRFVYVSPGTQRSLGYRPDELVGKPLVFFLHPDDIQATKLQLEGLAEQGKGTEAWRCRLRNKDGGWRWHEATGRNCTEEASIGGIAVSFQDVSRLSRMEAERQVISKVIHALNETSNLDQLLERIHQALKKVVYAENCFVALHNGEEGTFDFPFFVDQFDPAPPAQKIGRSCTAYVFRTGRATLIPQSVFDELAEKGEVELVGSPAPAWLGVPLKTPTATIGVLVVQHYQDEKAYEQRDLEFLDSVGGHIALAIERRRSDQALGKSEAMFRLLFSHNPLPTWVADRETRRFLQVNEAAVRQYGYLPEEFEKMSLFDIRPKEDREALSDHLKEDHVEGRYQGVWRHQTRGGRVFDAEVISHQLDYGGRPVLLVVAQDISERQLLEQQLRQAMKMEAVGRLAGGVAHDFNNLLMVIKGHTELLMNTLPAADQATRKVAQIERAADRATSLTRQLLAFSRRQVLQPRVLSLNTVVEDMSRLILRLIGEDIELVMRTAPDLGMIRADASQMEQVIMNLAVNARDAMPSGGKLVIETSNTELDHNYNLGHPVVRPGPYVLLAVSDTGTGMDAETKAHIFEPFFTTKEQGKGTGLGLATAYGVVKQSDGFIWVYSEVGKGTSFKIYLPRVEQPEEKVGTAPTFTEAPRGTETVLLAEDEQDVREVAREFLESGGYTVLEAQDGADAVRIAGEYKGAIDLLLTDIVMPGMSGQELAAVLKQQRAGMCVVFMSGYSEHAAAEATRSDSSVRLLTKPFSRGAILRMAREVLNQARPH